MDLKEKDVMYQEGFKINPITHNRKGKDLSNGLTHTRNQVRVKEDVRIGFALTYRLRASTNLIWLVFRGGVNLLFLKSNLAGQLI